MTNAVMYTCSFVETKGRTLEEINEIFKSPSPKRTSLLKHVILVTGDGILYQGIEGLDSEGDEAYGSEVISRL